MALKFALVIAAIAILKIFGMMGLVYRQGRGAPSFQDKDLLVEIARQKKAEGQDKARVSELLLIMPVPALSSTTLSINFPF